jgi:hypothetical protein
MHSDRPRENPGGNTVRRLRRLQNVPDSRGFFQDGQSTVSSLWLENGEYTKTEKDTLEELLWVHFPGSKTILEPSGCRDGLELESPKWKGPREDWTASRGVISYDKLKWAVFSFQPYKSPGIDGIMPIMLKQGFELLAGKLLMLVTASLALGYIPVSGGTSRWYLYLTLGNLCPRRSPQDPSVSCDLYSRCLRNYLTDMSGMVSWFKNHFTRTILPTWLVRLLKQHSSRLYID